jgi:hypothetical protein
MHSPDNDKGPDLLQKSLINRFKKDELAHFYLLRPHPHERDPQSALETWISQLLEQVWPQERPSSSESFTQHPDFLLIDNPSPSRAYQSKEHPGLLEWAKTQDYGPMELKRRWIIVHHAHTLTPSFCNKQLKTLEEPNKHTTIIFTDPQQSELLKTIESRAINIQIPFALNPRKLQRAGAQQDFITYLRSLPEGAGTHEAHQLAEALEGPIHEALEWTRSNSDLERQILEWVLDFERSRSAAPQLSAILQRLKWFEKSQLMNNSAQERWLTLLSPYFPSKRPS